MRSESAVLQTIKTFGSRLLLLFLSAVAFAAAVGLDSARPPRPDDAIPVEKLAGLIEREKPPWAGRLAEAVRGAAKELQVSQFDSEQAAMSATMRVLRKSAATFRDNKKDREVKDWALLPMKRADLVQKLDEELQTIDQQASRLLQGESRASEERKRQNRDRLNELLTQRALTEARYRLQLAKHDLRAMQLEQDLRDTFQRPLARIEAFRRPRHASKSMLDRVIGDITDSSTPLFSIYELLWYVALTAAVFCLAMFLFKSIIRLLPVDTEATLRARIDKLVERAPAAAIPASRRTSAAVGLTALGIGAGTILPVAAPRLLEPWQPPVTQIGRSFMPRMFSSPGSDGRDGRRGSDGSNGRDGKDGTDGFQRENCAGGATGVGCVAGCAPQPLRIEEVTVDLPDQWSKPLETARAELRARIEAVENRSTAYTLQKHHEAVQKIGAVDRQLQGVVADRVLPLENSSKEHNILLAKLGESDQLLLGKTGTLERTEQEVIQQATLWDSREWWRSLRSTYMVGPLAARAIARKHPELAKTFTRMATQTVPPMTDEQFVRFVELNMIAAGAADSPADARDKLTAAQALPFILKTCRLER